MCIMCLSSFLNILQLMMRLICNFLKVDFNYVFLLNESLYCRCLLAQSYLTATLCTGFPRQEYWSELPFPSPGDLPNPGIETVAPARSPSLQVDSFNCWVTGEAQSP